MNGKSSSSGPGYVVGEIRDSFKVLAEHLLTNRSHVMLITDRVSALFRLECYGMYAYWLTVIFICASCQTGTPRLFRPVILCSRYLSSNCKHETEWFSGVGRIKGNKRRVNRTLNFISRGRNQSNNLNLVFLCLYPLHLSRCSVYVDADCTCWPRQQRALPCPSRVADISLRGWGEDGCSPWTIHVL